MFRRPSYRKRSLLAMGFAFIGQSTAVLVINNYGPTLYKALGYGTKDQLALQCGWITVGIIFNFVGAALMDRIGRRPLMLFGISGCCVALILEDRDIVLPGQRDQCAPPLQRQYTGRWVLHRRDRIDELGGDSLSFHSGELI